jgi:hypothetical protein
MSYICLGELLVAIGEYEAALEMLGKGLERVAQLNEKLNVAIALDALALACRGLEHARQAARLWGAAEKIRFEIGSPRPPGEQEEILDEQKLARSALGDKAFDLEFQRGQEMTHEESVALGLAVSAAKYNA